MHEKYHLKTTILDELISKMLTIFDTNDTQSMEIKKLVDKLWKSQTLAQIACISLQEAKQILNEV